MACNKVTNKRFMKIETINITRDEKGKQSIHIPEDMQIEDDKVYLKKVGNVLYVIPYNDPWKSLIDSLDDFSDDFMEERDENWTK